MGHIGILWTSENYPNTQFILKLRSSGPTPEPSSQKQCGAPYLWLTKFSGCPAIRTPRSTNTQAQNAQGLLVKVEMHGLPNLANKNRGCVLEVGGIDRTKNFRAVK